jgi:hypothetical protein
LREARSWSGFFAYWGANFNASRLFDT